MVVWEKTEWGRDNHQHDRQNVSNYLAPIALLQLRFFHRNNRQNFWLRIYRVGHICRCREATPPSRERDYNSPGLTPTRTCECNIFCRSFPRGLSPNSCMHSCCLFGLLRELTRPYGHMLEIRRSVCI